MIKGDSAIRDTARVMLTPIGAQGDAERLRAAGYDAYVTRPTRTSQLADVVSGATPGRRSADEVVVFDSTGTAREDVAAAWLVYERALACGAGLPVDLGSAPTGESFSDV